MINRISFLLHVNHVNHVYSPYYRFDKLKEALNKFDESPV